jgi:hypothetical protein
VINAGRSMNSGKYPGFSAAIPSKDALAINEIVALYEEILSKNLT